MEPGLGTTHKDSIFQSNVGDDFQDFIEPDEEDIRSRST